MPVQLERPTEGLRVVSRNAGRCLDVVASPSSAYLLPDLADFSLLKRETGSGRSFHLVIEDEGILIQSSTSDAAAHAWQKWLGNLARLKGTSLGALHLSEPEVFSWPSVTQHVIDTLLQNPTSVMVPAVDPAATLPRTSGVHSGSAASPAEAVVASPLTEVAQVAQQLSRLSSLTDEQLSRVFKVERETFARWKSGALANPRLASRRRLGLLLRLFEELAAKDVVVRDWLLNQVTPEGRTPFEMLERGSFHEVAMFSAALPPAAGASTSQGLRGGEVDLVFADDDHWELDTDDDV